MKKISFKKRAAAIAAMAMVVSTASVSASAAITVGIDQVTVKLNPDGSVASASAQNGAGILDSEYNVLDSIDKTAKIVKNGTSYTVPVFVRLNDGHDGLTAVEFGIEARDENVSFTLPSGREIVTAGGEGELNWTMEGAFEGEKGSTSGNMAWLTWSKASADKDSLKASLILLTVENPTPNQKYPVSYVTTGAGDSKSVAFWKNGATVFTATPSDGWVEFVQDTTTTTTTTSTSTTTTTTSTSTTTTTSTSTTTTTTSTSTTTTTSSTSTTTTTSSTPTTTTTSSTPTTTTTSSTPTTTTTSSTTETTSTTPNKGKDNSSSKKSGTSSSSKTNTSTVSSSPKTGAADVLPIVGIAAAIAVLGGVAVVSKKKDD